MSTTTVKRIRRAATALLIVDLQERLLPAICEQQKVVQNCTRLIKGAAVLGLPTFITEQYRKGLGTTVPEILNALPTGVSPVEKLVFSACGAAGCVEFLKQKNIADVLLCGIETHVCVSQTCLDLLEKGFDVFVVADAASSRTPENHQLGLERMRGSGAVTVSTEMALFELIERAGTEEFKQVLGLVK